MKTAVKSTFVKNLSINDITLTSCGHEQTIVDIVFKKVDGVECYDIKYDNGSRNLKRLLQKVLRVVRVG